MRPNWIKYTYFSMIFLAHVLPLNSDFDFAMNNSYVLEGLRLDHLLHSLIFVPMYFFIQSYFVERNALKNIILSLFLGLFFGGLLECTQIFLPYRAFTLPDLFSNMIGVLIGFSLFIVFQKPMNKSTKLNINKL